MGSWSQKVAIAKYGSSLGCIVEGSYAEAIRQKLGEKCYLECS
ncbi:hypothetical protein PN499_20610 [Kamptonema animale CS-326]|nr:hypothetical protein [Kamptonema animale]MDB9513603.1 hypothetical protein [Kamptonema animale CS-326]